MAEFFENENEISGNDPSPENLTWEYLYRNFNKWDLQKRCRALGMDNVWTTKDKLVDMILQKTNQRRPTQCEREEEEEISLTTLSGIMEELRKLREQMQIKELRMSQMEKLLDDSRLTIDRLCCRITTLEDSIQNGSSVVNSKEQQNATPRPTQTLLLGDKNLINILSSDLQEQCLIRTINEANVDLMKCWISEKLVWIPARTILYCGIQDIMDGLSCSTVIDNLGALVTTLKEKNENMEIYVCELVPTLDGEMLPKINELNSELEKWTSGNNINLIKTDLPFRLGTGDVDDMCLEDFGKEGCSVLSRYGVIRLLSEIEKQYPLLNVCENITQIKRNSSSTSQARFKWSHNDYEDNHYRHAQRTRDYGITHRWSSGNYGDNRQRYNLRNSSEGRRVGLYPSGTYNQYSRNAQAHFHRTYYSPNDRKTGCYNCGEFNHRQSGCRFDHKIKCGNCNQLGHKNRLCPVYER